jgi:hydrogenase nickel incorporation protein HypB
MCKDCGCTIAGEEHHHHHDERLETIHSNPQLNDKKTLEVITKILDKNDKEAKNNRSHFEAKNILAINLMSSAGSGKTTLLEKSAELANFKFGVIEGDLETNLDADRLKAKGVEAYQITTGTACHLDAFMVHKAIHNLNMSDLNVVFVENVGNLVCPASYDVGTHLNVVLLSIPEGDDKVVKYPVMFKSADLILITKTDLREYFNFDIDKVKKDARILNPKVDILEISSKDSESIKKWLEYIEFKMRFR